MASATSLLVGLLSLLAFWCGVFFFDSYVVAVLFLIAAVLIGKSLQPVVLMLWDMFQKRFFPLPPVHVFHSERFPESGMVDDVPAYMLGMRVLAMTEELNGSKNKKIYREMVDESLEKLDREFDLFRIRHAAVERRQSPVEYTWATCGTDGELMTKCFKAWLKSPNVAEMKARQQNRDLFLHDGTVATKDGQPVRYTVMVLFDYTLPLTIPKEDSLPQVQELPTEEK